jgi:hypothetical protein
MTETNRENLPKLFTQLIIDAPRSRVWEVLSDFGAYSQWSATMQARELPSQVAPGERAMFCAVPGRDWERLFEVEILRVEPPALLEWQGGVPDTFFGVHRFELQEEGPDRTLFTNSEFFSGSMVESMMQKHGDAAREEFEEFNEELRKRAEESARQPLP